MNDKAGNLYLPRQVRDVTSGAGLRGRSSRRPFEEFFASDAIVLLGDPGMGKTELFRRMASEEGGEYLQVRTFQQLKVERFRGKTLYLDGLDEVRATSSEGLKAIDSIVQRLDELGRPKFRLSCRPADWFGSLDEDSLRNVSRSESVTTLALEPFSDDQILELVESILGTNSRDFIFRARDRGIEDLLRNPQTLQMVVKVVEAEGAWPSSRKETYERAVQLLARERNEVHCAAQGSGVTTEQVLQASGFLCAVQLLSGVAGFAISPLAEDDDHPFIDDVLQCESHVFRTATSKKLFSIADGRAIPVHRSVAEFLAADFIVNRIRQGLPVGRCLALIQGTDGGVPSDRRGLFGWLGTLASDKDHVLFSLDPLAIITYGDAAHLPDAKKRSLLEEVARLAERDPYFRADHWDDRPFGGLVSESIAPDLVQLAQDGAARRHLAITALDALVQGKPVPGIGDELLSMALNEDLDIAFRTRAVQAFAHNCPDRLQCLTELLDEVVDGMVEDPHYDLRGELLKQLFPRVIRPRDLPSYLVVDPASDGMAATYRGFLWGIAYGRLADEELSELLDALAQSELCTKLLTGVGHTIYVFLGRTLVHGLERFGEHVELSRLHLWLTIPVTAHGSSVLEPEERKAIRAWIEARPTVLRKLYRQTVTESSFRDLPHSEYAFWSGMVFVQPPDGFGYELLNMAADDSDERRAEFFFVEAWRLATRDARGFEPTIEEFFAFAELHPWAESALEQERSMTVPEYHLEFTRRKHESQFKDRETIDANFNELMLRLPDVRAGIDVPALCHLVNIQEGRVDLADRSLPKESRIEALYGAEIATAAARGFVMAIGNEGQPTPEEIGKAAAQGRGFRFGCVVLAGMSNLWSADPEALLSLPEGALARAVAYRFRWAGSLNDPWLVALAAEKVEVVARGIKDYLTPPLGAKSTSAHGLWALVREPAFASVARRIAQSLLEEFPRAEADSLRALILATYLYGSKVKLLECAHRELENYHGLRTSQYLLWLTTAFLLEPGKYGSKLVQHASQSADKAHEIASFFSELTTGESAPMFGTGIYGVQAPLAVQFLVEGWGQVCNPEDIWVDGFSSRYRSSLRQAVSRMVDGLAGSASDEARGVLEALSKKKRLRPWRVTLVHALEKQAALRRDASFEAPEPRTVAETFRGGAPANPRDLQALVLKHMEELGIRIRHGAEDIFKRFWNTDKHNRPTSPVVEEGCRDLFTELLRARLEPLGIHIETEARHADQARSDQKAQVVFAGSNPMVLPIEAKRHMHSELWTGIKDQLIPKYTQDPGASGFGIYVVFWFGVDSKRRLVTPPQGVPKPSSAEELEKALVRTIPESHRDRLAVICIDVSRPTCKS